VALFGVQRGEAKLLRQVRSRVQLGNEQGGVPLGNEQGGVLLGSERGRVPRGNKQGGVLLGNEAAGVQHVNEREGERAEKGQQFAVAVARFIICLASPYERRTLQRI
jgi:hypothetical protein